MLLLLLSEFFSKGDGPFVFLFGGPFAIGNNCLVIGGGADDEIISCAGGGETPVFPIVVWNIVLEATGATTGGVKVIVGPLSIFFVLVLVLGPCSMREEIPDDINDKAETEDNDGNDNKEAVEWYW